MPIRRRKSPYTIGVDLIPSENHMTRFSAVIVDSRNPFEVVGTLQGLLHNAITYRFLVALTKVGRVIVERNGPSLSALESKVGWGYPNIYYKSNG